MSFMSRGVYKVFESVICAIECFDYKNNKIFLIS